MKTIILLLFSSTVFAQTYDVILPYEKLIKTDKTDSSGNIIPNLYSIKMENNDINYFQKTIDGKMKYCGDNFYKVFRTKKEVLEAEIYSKKAEMWADSLLNVKLNRIKE